MKAVSERLDVPALPLISLRFAEWIAGYTLTPLGMVARMMMSAQAAFEPVKPRFGVRIVADAGEPARMTPARPARPGARARRHDTREIGARGRSAVAARAWWTAS
jgi:primosomal protein N'